MKAIELVLDRMGGKPLQAVEVATEHSFNFLSEAERIRITESAQKIKRMQAEMAARQLGGLDLTLLPSASARDQQSASPTSLPPGETSAALTTKMRASGIRISNLQRQPQ